MSTSEAVKELRRRLGLSQQAFGSHLGFSIASIQNYEGGRTPAADALIRLATVASENGTQSLAHVFWKALVNELGLGGKARFFGFREEAGEIPQSYLFWGTDSESDPREREALNALLLVLFTARLKNESPARERALEILEQVAKVLKTFENGGSDKKP